MKKLLLFVFIIAMGLPAFAHAAGESCNLSNPCTYPETCGSICKADTAGLGTGAVCVSKAGSADLDSQKPYTPSVTNSPPSTASAPPGDSTFVPLAPIPGLTDSQSNISSSSIAGFLNNLYKFLIGIAAALAIIMIIWGGWEIMTQDSISKHGEGRSKIEQALLGLGLILAPVLVFTIINPSILNLNVEIPPLQTPEGVALEQPANKVDPDQLQPGQIVIACTDNPSCLAAKKKCTDDGSTDAAVKCVDTGGTLHMVSVIVGAFGIYSCGGENQSLAVVCSTPGHSGTDPNDGSIKSIFDGGYTDLVRFTGEDAYKKAGAYTCQDSSQIRYKAFSNTAQTNWYAICYTPTLSYRTVESLSGKIDDSPVDKGSFDLYKGQCQALDDGMSAEGFTPNFKFSYTVGSEVSCTAAESAYQACYSSQASCKPQ